MKLINEGTMAARRVEFFNVDELPAAPTAISYRIDCISTGQVVRAATPITPAAAVDLVLTPADTAIKDRRNNQETKRVTLVAQNAEPNDQVTAQFDYVVVQLPHLGG